MVLETALETDLSDHLGYDRGDPAGRGSPNMRNGAFLRAQNPRERDARVLPGQTVSAGATVQGPLSRQGADQGEQVSEPVFRARMGREIRWTLEFAQVSGPQASRAIGRRRVRKGCFYLRPQQDSNLRTRLRRPLLYPLSYGGRRRSPRRIGAIAD